MTTKKDSTGKKKKRLSHAAMCDATARNLATLVEVSDFEFITDMVVDATCDVSKRVGNGGLPDGWVEAKPGDPTGEGVKALARWLRRVPLTLSLRDPVAKNADDETRQRCAARYLTDASNTYGLPDFIMSAILVALASAAERFGLELPAWVTAEDGDGGGGSLAEFWRRIPDNYNPNYEVRHDLAGHIAAVLADEKTPERIFNALAEAVTELTARDDVTNSAEVIRIALKLDAERKVDAS